MSKSLYITATEARSGKSAVCLGVMEMLFRNEAEELKVELKNECRSKLPEPLPRWLLIAGGLGLARFLAGPDTLQMAFAIWGFFLVQSFFFLVGGIAERVETTAGLDPFEVARSRALALMEGDG